MPLQLRCSRTLRFVVHGWHPPLVDDVQIGDYGTLKGAERAAMKASRTRFARVEVVEGHTVVAGYRDGSALDGYPFDVLLGGRPAWM